MNSSRHASPQQSGFSMVEVLVTLIILLIGLLGLAGLMVQSQRSEMESYQRVQALVLLQDMAGRLNANRLAAQSCYSFTAAGAGAPFVGEGSTLASPAPPALATTITDATCTQANILTNVKAELNVTTLLPATGTQAFPDAQATYNTAVANATLAAPAAVSTALADLTAWHNALLGAAETLGGANAGAMVKARGCISYDATQETPQLSSVNGLPTGVTIPGTGLYTVSVAWQGKGDTFAPTLTCGQGLYTSEMSRRVVSLTFRIASLR